MTRLEAVSIIYQPPRILLGMKKIKFGKGKYNGFGGGVKDGESLEECAIRETLEESHITPINPERMGKIRFQFEGDEQDHLVHFFRAMEFLGQPLETREMKPVWINISNIPYSQMWADDKYWLPLLISGKKFKGNFLFDVSHQIVNYELYEVMKLD